jgi:hypothetical protein
LNPRPHEAQLEDQKPKKSSRMSYRRWKTRKTNKWQEKRQTKKKANKNSNSKLPLIQTSPNTLSASSPPYVEFIMFLLSTIQLAGVLPTLCTYSPFGNELIQHNPREE